MNTRARRRLIGVTAMIAVIVGAIILYATNSEWGAGAVGATVAEALDEGLVGEKIQVTGVVVSDSWDKGTRPMDFEIRDPEGDPDLTMRVVYDGTVPDTFGNLTPVIVTGTQVEPGVIESTDMVVSCPTKYGSSEVLTVAGLLDRAADVENDPVMVGGTIASLDADGFTLEGDDETVDVEFDEDLPDGVGEGSDVVVGGALGQDGVFAATTVGEPEE